MTSPSEARGLRSPHRGFPGCVGHGPIAFAAPTTQGALVATQDKVDQAKLDAEHTRLKEVKRVIDGKHGASTIEAIARTYRAVAGGKQPTTVSISK